MTLALPLLCSLIPTTATDAGAHVAHAGQTDIVSKRSSDNGTTWSALQVVFSNSSTNDWNVIGNAAPVWDAIRGRIVLPFTRNNERVFVAWSSDGSTWSTPQDITSTTTRASWKWIGTGPPGSLLLPSSGRIVVPAYHSAAPHDTDGELSRSHSMVSDDGGATWTLGQSLAGPYLSNECQAALLSNGSLLLNARSLLLDRIGSISNDGGMTWGAPFVFAGLVQPLEGCEGSTIAHPANGWLFFSIPNNPSPLRYNMSVLVSKDNGSSWSLLRVIDTGRTAYSALAIMPDQSVVLLYERANHSGIIFIPQHISFVRVWSPTTSTDGDDASSSLPATTVRGGGSGGGIGSCSGTTTCNHSNNNNSNQANQPKRTTSHRASIA
jgi:sialidase-1